uniref:Uncharacterized protein n=1 Tax=Desertifilum tharense IPPAS B-1220 TaxID=1781255 RepID=A0ACD5GSV4_9CYAN
MEPIHTKVCRDKPISHSHLHTNCPLNTPLRPKNHATALLNFLSTTKNRATALKTQHSEIPPPSHLPTLFPTQHSALYTQHSEIPPPSSHSELGTRNFALLSPLSTQHSALSTLI